MLPALPGLPIVGTSLILLCLALAVAHALSLRALRRRTALELAHRDARIDELARELEALLACSRGLGATVQRQARELRAMAQRQEQLAAREPGDTQYRHAAALTERGASLDEIVAECGLSRGEAELLARMKSLRSDRTPPASRR